MECQIVERLLKCQEYLLFSKHHHKLWDQRKNFDHFFLAFYHNDTWMIPKPIDSVCNLVNSGDAIIVITMISRYFQVWNNIDEKFVKNFCYSLIFCNYFFWNYFLLTFLERYFRFCFYFISKKWLYQLRKGFALCDVDVDIWLNSCDVRRSSRDWPYKAVVFPN